MATKTSLNKWIRAASNFIALISSRLLRQILANPFLSWILEDCMYQSSGNEKEGCCLFFPSSTKHEIWHFHVVVVQRRQEMYKKSMMLKVLFDQSKPIAFLPFSLPSSLLKLPIREFTQRWRRRQQERQKSDRKLDWQNNTFARASRFFVHFSTVIARLQRDTAKFHVLSRTGKKDNFLFHFLNFDAVL